MGMELQELMTVKAVRTAPPYQPATPNPTLQEGHCRTAIRGATSGIKPCSSGQSADVRKSSGTSTTPLRIEALKRLSRSRHLGLKPETGAYWFEFPGTNLTHPAMS